MRASDDEDEVVVSAATIVLIGFCYTVNHWQSACVPGDCVSYEPGSYEIKIGSSISLSFVLCPLSIFSLSAITSVTYTVNAVKYSFEYVYSASNLSVRSRLGRQRKKGMR